MTNSDLERIAAVSRVIGDVAALAFIAATTALWARKRGR